MQSDSFLFLLVLATELLVAGALPVPDHEAYRPKLDKRQLADAVAGSAVNRVGSEIGDTLWASFMPHVADARGADADPQHITRVLDGLREQAQLVPARTSTASSGDGGSFHWSSDSDKDSVSSIDSARPLLASHNARQGVGALDALAEKHYPGVSPESQRWMDRLFEPHHTPSSDKVVSSTPTSWRDRLKDPMHWAATAGILAFVLPATTIGVGVTKLHHQRKAHEEQMRQAALSHKADNSTQH